MEENSVVETSEELDKENDEAEASEELDKENDEVEASEELDKENDEVEASEEFDKENDKAQVSEELKKENDDAQVSEELKKEDNITEICKEKQEKKKINLKDIIHRLSTKKIKGKIKIAVIVSIVCVIIGVVGTTIILKSSKGEGFIIKKTVEPTKKPVITYKEYIKNTTEYFYDRLIVNIGKDYIGQVTLGEEIIFIKEKTNQKMIFYIKENKTSKKDAKNGLVKYVKKLNEGAKFVETVVFDKNEYDIYQGLDKKGNIIKYVITANNDTRILITYTYSKDGEDEDLKHILKSMRY